MSIHGMQMQHEHVHRAWPASKADHSCWPPYNWPPEWRKAWTHTLIQPAAYQTPVPLPPLPSNGTHHNVHSNEMAAETYNAVCCSNDQTPTLQTILQLTVTCPMGAIWTYETPLPPKQHSKPITRPFKQLLIYAHCTQHFIVLHLVVVDIHLLLIVFAAHRMS